MKPMRIIRVRAVPIFYNAESLIRETLEVKDGQIRPPEGPGLGVTLDGARLAAVPID